MVVALNREVVPTSVVWFDGLDGLDGLGHADCFDEHGLMRPVDTNMQGK